MKLKIIKTENYLFVADDTDIKEGDIYVRFDNGILFATLKNSNPEIVKNHCKKIIAHLPLNYTLIKGAKMPTFTKIPLLPLLDFEDNVDMIANERYPISMQPKGRTLAGGVYDVDVNYMERLAYKHGYNKAKEKLDEVLKWIDEEILLNPYYKDSSRLKEGVSIVKAKIQSLSQPKTPTHFEFEMKQKSLNGSIPVNQEWEFEPKTTTNAQGQQVACGK